MATAFKNSHTANTGSTNLPTIVLATGAVAVGDLLVARIVFDPAVSCSTAQDSNFNTWQRATFIDHGGAGAHRFEIWFSVLTSVAVTVNPGIQFVLSGTAGFSICGISNYSGSEQNMANILGTIQTGNCDGSCGASPISMTTPSMAVNAGSIVYQTGQTDNGTPSVTAPWNDRGTDTSIGISISDQVNVSAGNFAGQMLDSGLANDDWDLAIVEFKAPNVAPVDVITLTGQYQLR